MLTPEQQMAKALQQSKVYEQLESVHASSPNAANSLQRKLSILEDIQKNADKWNPYQMVLYDIMTSFVQQKLKAQQQAHVLWWNITIKQDRCHRGIKPTTRWEE